MPTYDYECPRCGLTREVSHSIRDEPKVMCQACGAADKPVKMKRLISLGTTFALKGGGWEKDGYR